MESFVALLGIVPFLNGLHTNNPCPGREVILGVWMCLHLVSFKPMLDRELLGDIRRAVLSAVNRKRLGGWPRAFFYLIEVILPMGIPRKRFNSKTALPRNGFLDAKKKDSVPILRGTKLQCVAQPVRKEVSLGKLVLQIVVISTMFSRPPKSFDILEQEEIRLLSTDDVDIGLRQFSVVSFPAFLFPSNGKVGAWRPSDEPDQIPFTTSDSDILPQLFIPLFCKEVVHVDGIAKPGLRDPHQMAGVYVCTPK